MRWDSLGCVDISTQPDKSADEMKEGKVSARQLVETGEDAPELLDLADEALHQMSFLVEMRIIGVWLAAPCARRYHGERPTLEYRSEEVTGVVRAICDHIRTRETGDEPLRLGHIVCFSSCQRKAQRVAERIDTDMDLGAEPAAAPSQRLGRMPTVFLGAPAAEGWARTMVLSRIRCSRSGSVLQC